MASYQVLVRGSSWFSRLKHRHQTRLVRNVIPHYPIFNYQYLELIIQLIPDFGHAKLVVLYYYLHSLF